MQDEPEDLERDHAEQRFVARFAEDHGRVAFALWAPDVALGHVALPPKSNPVDRLTRGVRARRLAPRETCRDGSSPARKETRMIYEVRTYRIAPRSLPEVEKRFGEAYEYRKKYSELFAFWHTEIGSLNEIVHVWPYREHAERERIRGEAAREPKWKHGS